MSLPKHFIITTLRAVGDERKVQENDNDASVMTHRNQILIIIIITYTYKYY